MTAYDETKEALKYPQLLQKRTWQEVVSSISEVAELTWLVKVIYEKYGI